MPPLRPKHLRGVFPGCNIKARVTPAEFKRKWARYSGKETAAYQEHFNDLCALLSQPTPAAADPTGASSFCFQKRVVKDEELFARRESGRVAEESNGYRERGFADVWKRGCFAWEYKGKKKNLDDAYQQLLRYRESLLNPPLLVVCDFDRYIVRTNFNGTVQETHEFKNAQIDTPGFCFLRAVFTDPEFLKPQRTTAEVTKNWPAQIGEVARSLQERETSNSPMQDAEGTFRRPAKEPAHRPLSQSHRLLLLRGRHRPAAEACRHRYFQRRRRRPGHSPKRSNSSRTMATGGASAKTRFATSTDTFLRKRPSFELNEEEIGKLSLRQPSRLAIHPAQHHGQPYSSARSNPINAPSSARTTPARKTS